MPISIRRQHPDILHEARHDNRIRLESLHDRVIRVLGLGEVMSVPSKGIVLPAVVIVRVIRHQNHEPQASHARLVDDPVDGLKAASLMIPREGMTLSGLLVLAPQACERIIVPPMARMAAMARAMRPLDG